jgi:hypothetical protein
MKIFFNVTFTLCLLLVSEPILFAQSGNVPNVIALYFNEIKMDSLASAELKIYANDKAVTDEFRKSFLRDGLAPNWKTIRQKELAFMEQQDFFSLLILSVTRELTYKEVENRSNLLIYPTKEKSESSLTAYKKIIDQNKMSWLVNFTKAEAGLVNGKRSLTIAVQLFNAIQPRLFLDKKYTIDASTVSDAASCEEIWACYSQQIAVQVAVDLMDKIERNIRLAR